MHHQWHGWDMDHGRMWEPCHKKALERTLGQSRRFRPLSPTPPDPSRPKPTKKDKKNVKDKEAKKTSTAPEPDPSDHDEEDGGESQRSSTAATSEIKSLLRRRMRQEQSYRPQSSLGSVRIEEFYGDRGRFLKWKRTIQAQQHLYNLEGNELAMLIYLSTKKEARDVVEQYPLSCYTEAGGLHLLWKVLDESFGESEAELFERADKEFQQCRRQPGETVAHYLAEMRRLRAQLARVDPDSKMSDRAWGQRLLQRASLTRREKHDVYYSAGACFDPLSIEKALRLRCGRIHEEEKRGTYKNYEDKGGGGGGKSRPKGHYFKKKIIVKKAHHAHVAEGLDEEEALEEDGQEQEEDSKACLTLNPSIPTPSQWSIL